jgi:hypothetical protein
MITTDNNSIGPFIYIECFFYPSPSTAALSRIKVASAGTSHVDYHAQGDAREKLCVRTVQGHDKVTVLLNIHAMCNILKRELGKYYRQKIILQCRPKRGYHLTTGLLHNGN